MHPAKAGGTFAWSPSACVRIRHSGSLILAVAGLASASAMAQQLTGRPPSGKLPREVRMQTILHEAEQLARQAALPAAGLTRELANRGISIREDGRVHVEIVGPRGAKALSADDLKGFGGEVQSTWLHRTDAYVPVVQLTAGWTRWAARGPPR